MIKKLACLILLLPSSTFCSAPEPSLSTGNYVVKRLAGFMLQLPSSTLFSESEPSLSKRLSRWLSNKLSRPLNPGDRSFAPRKPQSFPQLQKHLPHPATVFGPTIEGVCTALSAITLLSLTGYAPETLVFLAANIGGYLYYMSDEPAPLQVMPVNQPKRNGAHPSAETAGNGREDAYLPLPVVGGHPLNAMGNQQYDVPFPKAQPRVPASTPKQRTAKSPEYPPTQTTQTTKPSPSLLEGYGAKHAVAGTLALGIAGYSVKYLYDRRAKKQEEAKKLTKDTPNGAVKPKEQNPKPTDAQSTADKPKTT